ncbi:MAG: hypothetical protein LRY51_04400 [Geovibrio sp.]|nr:hypothetical protein [Geovibrio sp.]
MSFEWSPEQGKYAAVMTEYSFGDEIASRMKNIHGESSLFTDIGVYSLGTSAVDSAAVYGAELSPDDFAVFADVHEEQTFFLWRILFIKHSGAMRSSFSRGRR